MAVQTAPAGTTISPSTETTPYRGSQVHMPGIHETTAPDYPREGRVINTETYGNGAYTGTYKPVPENKVDSGFQFGEDGDEFTGTMAGGSSGGFFRSY